MSFDDEQLTKAELIKEAFELHHIELPNDIKVYSDENQYHYRNKVEFSWWWDTDFEQLDLAFFRRGGRNKVPVTGTSLAQDPINELAIAIRDVLRAKSVEARMLKTLLIRCNRDGGCVWQLYIKAKRPKLISEAEASLLPALGGEIIYSDPRSPASKITERLAAFGDTMISDHILDKKFNYAAESFFQVNIPAYEQSLQDMAKWVQHENVIDLYSGVGSIGLTIGGSNTVLVEVDENAFREMERNIKLQKREDTTTPVLAPSEKALDYIQSDATIIVDPPRVGLHQAVVDKLLDVVPPRIIYLSCNPVTQARDVELLKEKYEITAHQGYNYFPRTPHIEHLVVLTAK
jgi:23S rRNA (uracil1939-C5)-methyltransferase